MDPRGQLLAALLDASGGALASGAVARLAEGEDAEHVQREGFGRLVAEARGRLDQLAEASAVGRPELFAMEVEWAATGYAARGIPLGVLGRQLGALREEIELALPAEHAGGACALLDRTRRAVLDAPPTAPASFLRDGAPHVERARSYLLALLEGRSDDAHRVVLDALDGVDDGASVSELHQHVLVPVQAEVGRLWQAGEVDVAEEHLGSHVVAGTLALLRARMPRTPRTGRAVLVAAVRGNLHELGAQMVSDAFELAGWRSFFLGADTPSEDLVAAAGHFGVDLVALSCNLVLALRGTAALVEELRARHGALPVLVGGRPFAALPDLWRAVGADGSAPDAAGAVREGERLVGPR